MRPHRTTDTTPRAWRVITHHDNPALERNEVIVQAIQSYELAMHAFRQALDQYKRSSDVLSVELRDPSGRCILDTHYQFPCTEFEPIDDGLIDVPNGRYAWIDSACRHEPIKLSEVRR